MQLTSHVSYNVKGWGGLPRTSFFSSPKLSLPPLHSTQVGFFLSLFALFRSSFFCLLFFFFLGSPKSSPLPSPPFYLPSSLKSFAHVLLNSLQCFLCLEIWKVLLYLEFLRIHHFTIFTWNHLIIILTNREERLLYLLNFLKAPILSFHVFMYGQSLRQKVAFIWCRLYYSILNSTILHKTNSYLRNTYTYSRFCHGILIYTGERGTCHISG